MSLAIETLEEDLFYCFNAEYSKASMNIKSCIDMDKNSCDGIYAKAAMKLATMKSEGFSHMLELSRNL